MADNLKVDVVTTYSENTDYSDPEWITAWDPYEIDPDEAALNLMVLAQTGGTTIDTTALDLTDGAAMLMVIKNLDTTNYVQVAYTDISTTACVNRIPAGGLFVAPMVDPSTGANTGPVLTANTANVRCRVIIAQA